MRIFYRVLLVISFIALLVLAFCTFSLEWVNVKKVMLCWFVNVFIFVGLLYKNFYKTIE